MRRLRHDRGLRLCRGPGPRGGPPRRQGGGGKLHPGYPGGDLAGIYAAGGVFLLGYFLSAGLTEGWRYAVAIVAAAVSFIPIKLYDGYARKRDTLTYTIVREF